jgi:8-oxo-dGTP pyrophosphatase MutT (NUDIX family)
MPVSESEINGTVQAYIQDYPDEADRLKKLLKAMREPDADLGDRSVFDPGHITASALVINPQGQVLYLLDDHKQRWLLPGGHLGPRDASLVDAARRETFEEAGIHPDDLVLPESAAPGRALDIGVRKSKGSAKRGEKPHLHFDIRFPLLARADPDPKINPDQAAAFRWMPPPASPPVRLGAKLAGLL